MADKAVVLKKSQNSNQAVKVKRATSTPRKCMKAQTLTSPFKRDANLSKSSAKCRTPNSVSKNLFKVSVSSTCLKSKPKKCLDNASSLSPNRKSVSLIDLTPISMDCEINTARSDDVSTLSDKSKILQLGMLNQQFSNVNTWQDDDAKSQDQKLYNAGRIVCHMLAINAWRRRKEEIVRLNEVIDVLNQQVNQLQMQIVVLRRLFDKENGRVDKLTTEVQQIKNQVDEKTQECEVLKKEKETVENELEKMKDMYEDRIVKEKNALNDLSTVRSQLEATTDQISRDREQLLKLREDKKILLKKISASEKIATENEKRANEAEFAVEELQLKLAAQLYSGTLLEKEKNECKEKLEAAIEEQNRLKKQLKYYKENEKLKNKDVSIYKNKLSDMEYALRRVEAEYSLVLSELNKLRASISCQSEYSNWGNRILQITGSIVRAPQAIFRSLSFF